MQINRHLHDTRPKKKVSTYVMKTKQDKTRQRRSINKEKWCNTDGNKNRDHQHPPATAIEGRLAADFPDAMSYCPYERLFP